MKNNKEFLESVYEKKVLREQETERRMRRAISIAMPLCVCVIVCAAIMLNPMKSGTNVQGGADSTQETSSVGPWQNAGIDQDGDLAGVQGLITTAENHGEPSKDTSGEIPSDMTGDTTECTTDETTADAPQTPEN